MSEKHRIGCPAKTKRCSLVFLNFLYEKHDLSKRIHRFYVYYATLLYLIQRYFVLFMKYKRILIISHTTISVDHICISYKT